MGEMNSGLTVQRDKGKKKRPRYWMMRSDCPSRWVLRAIIVLSADICLVISASRAFTRAVL